MVLFEVVTKYKNWEEIKNGNVAVALATGGKILGVCNIFRYSIERIIAFRNDWMGIIRFYLIIIAYFLFEFLTPKFNVDEEIEKDNRSVGLFHLLFQLDYHL